MAPRALIFDMDGTLLDSEPMHFACAREIFAEDGLDFTLAYNAEFIGQSSEQVMEQLVARHKLPRTPRQYIEIYETRIVQVMSQASACTDGVPELIAEAQARGLKLGVASNSSGELVRATLTGLKLIHHFGALVGGDMVPRGKPAPDVYLEAARRLGVDPRDCVAIEDSPTGIAAVQAAGMKDVALLTAHVDPARFANVSVLIKSLRDFPLELL